MNYMLSFFLFFYSQDELGRLVLNVAHTVPHGVLCFLPSYSLLEKLVERWNNTGLIKHLEQVKTIVLESRNSNEFEETLKSFYQAIKDSEEYVCTAFNIIQISTFYFSLSIKIIAMLS